MKYIKLIGCIILCQTAGFLGTLTGTSDSLWYQMLEKPIFQPPNFVFGPVWITLYTFMGIALWMIWQQKTKQSKKAAYWFFFIQLILNSIWSWLFFGINNILLAGTEILILLSCIVITAKLFWNIKKQASILLWPYILWVSFATLLTWTLYVLNF